MTDARIPDRWLSDRRLQRLSDVHFRAFITSLVWSVSNRTNGVIEPEDLRLIPNFAAGAAKGIDQHRVVVTAGGRVGESAITPRHRPAVSSWRPRRLHGFVNATRRLGSVQRSVSLPAPTLTSRGLSPGTTQDRTGQARTGQERRPRNCQP